MDTTSWLTFMNLLMLLKVTVGLEKELSCAVCRSLVDEVNYSISKVDPKKTIQVGSFRVDSRGNQGTYEKSYARSEIHLIEIFEEVCSKFKEYGETTNEAGQKSIVRTGVRDGKTLSLKNIKFNSGTAKSLMHKCETLIEEYEDEMITQFRKEDVPDTERIICGELTSECTESDLEIPMPVVEQSDNEFPVGHDKPPADLDDDEKTDEEMVNKYLKDNTESDSIPADTIVEKTGGEQENKKDEL